MLEQDELAEVLDSFAGAMTFPTEPLKMGRTGEAGRLLGYADGNELAMAWTDQQAFAYVRGHSPSELDAAAKRAKRLFDAKQIDAGGMNYNALMDFLSNNADTFNRVPVVGEDPWEFLDFIEYHLGPGSTLTGRKTISLNEESEVALALNNHLIRTRSWNKVKKAARLREQSFGNAAQYAAESAVRDIMPFIDSHEMRSQFADWGRGFLPFWYAEENFLKRWARIFSLDGPAGTLATARKMQLTANGLRTMGVIRTDAQGKQYFVYPGSDLLVETIGSLPFIELVPLSVMLQTPVERMIPGFNPQFGAPSFAPTIGFPIELVQSFFPESQDVLDFQRSVMGDMAASRDWFDYIVPAQVKNTMIALDAFARPEAAQSNERIASAMMAAMANLESTGVYDPVKNPNGLALKPNASNAEVDDYIRKVRDHARIIVFSQALAGWFTPGPASALQTPSGNSLQWITDGAISSPQEMLSSTYYDLIKELGIEEGTQRYLEIYSNNRIKDVVQPLAFTVSRTETPSGAPLPSTEAGIQFYDDNRAIIDQYKYAGAWLLPNDGSSEERSQYAYDSEVIAGLRDRKTPDEFMRELKFREGANVYFSSRKSYLDQYEALRAANQDAAARDLKARYDVWSKNYLATHPVFSELLQDSTARQRREDTIEEMRYVLNDPEAPKAAHFDSLKILMDSYDSYTVEKSRLGLDHSAAGRARLEILKKNFDSWVANFVSLNPGVNTFWMTVLRPEAGLD